MTPPELISPLGYTLPADNVACCALIFYRCATFVQPKYMPSSCVPACPPPANHVGTKTRKDSAIRLKSAARPLSPPHPFSGTCATREYGPPRLLSHFCTFIEPRGTHLVSTRYTISSGHDLNWFEPAPPYHGVQLPSKLREHRHVVSIPLNHRRLWIQGAFLDGVLKGVVVRGAPPPGDGIEQLRLLAAPRAKARQMLLAESWDAIQLNKRGFKRVLMTWN